MAGRILARTGDPYRSPTEAAFAEYTGTAPVEIASADQSRHRLSRLGDRTLNSAIHVVAMSRAPLWVSRSAPPGLTIRHRTWLPGLRWSVSSGQRPAFGTCRYGFPSVRTSAWRGGPTLGGLTDDFSAPCRSVHRVPTHGRLTSCGN
ncbi:transposase [Rhodococcus opacus PD630]|uniref:transposase n=1 Tax=Rhodococcus opacus TaxID=37919 RepID=UPI00029CBBD6|nr:transposase [Rhodococcus opacus]EHI47229.1 transposase [Rhodococcus opacus PD630]